MTFYKTVGIFILSLTFALVIFSPNVVRAAIPQSLSNDQLSSIILSLQSLLAELKNNLSKVPRPSFLAQVSVSTAQFGTGKIWQVGPDRQYKKPSDVVNLVQNGDTVEIDSAVYKCDTGVRWNVDNLTLRGVGGRPHLDATDCQIPGGKGIWNPGGKNLLIENIEFSGASVSDTNGAGIRYDGGGEVTIRNSYFHDNQNGILFTPTAKFYNRDDVSLLIEYSKFSKNGYKDGHSHNLYIQRIGEFTFRYNISEASIVGHLVKTRAKKNYILYNRLVQGEGTGSYEIDISEGGETYIVGNIIQQGPTSQNRGMIGYAAEAPKAAVNGEPDREMKLYVVNNTIINDHPVLSTGIQIFDDIAITEVLIANNLVTGINEERFIRYRNPEKGTASKTTLRNNVLTASPGFLDRNQFSYYLTSDSPAIDAGTVLGNKNTFSLTPTSEYLHQARSQNRPINGAIDVGAYEYTGRSIAKPSLSLTSNSTQLSYNTSATLTWSTQNVSSCVASGAWSGTRSPNGQETIGPLTEDTTFILNCAGVGGNVEMKINLFVDSNPTLVNYPEYEFIRLPNTKLRSVCDENKLIADNGCGVMNKQTTATYDSKRNAVYFWQGGNRSYWSNGILALDLNTKTLSRLTEATDPTKIADYTGTMYKLINPCTGIWTFTDGSGIVPAPILSYSSFLYLSDIDKVASIGGKPSCGSPTFTDNGWFFDPGMQKWELKYTNSIVPKFGTNGFLDTKTNTLILGNNRGVYRYDYRTGSFTALGGATPKPWTISSVVDPRNKLWLFLGGNPGNSTLPILDLSNLDLNKTLPEYESTWKVFGDTSILGIDAPGIAYDSDKNVLLGWRGDGKIYFIEPDKAKKEITIVSQSVEDSPIMNVNNIIYNKFMYIPSLQAFLVFVDIDQDMYLLKATGKKISLSDNSSSNNSSSGKTSSNNSSSNNSSSNNSSSNNSSSNNSSSNNSSSNNSSSNNSTSGNSNNEQTDTSNSTVIQTDSQNQSPKGGFRGSASSKKKSSDSTLSGDTLSVCTPAQNMARGSEGADVINLQKFLEEKGELAPDNTTGFFGPVTEEAVKSFQRRYGIVSFGTPASTGYGAVGPITRKQILSLTTDAQACSTTGQIEKRNVSGTGTQKQAQTVTPSRETSPVVPTVTSFTPRILLTRNLAIGKRGADVTNLQNFLVKKGYLTADNATGYFGYVTQSAIQSLQRDFGIVYAGTPDTTGYGAVGPMTREKINSLITTSEPEVLTNDALEALIEDLKRQVEELVRQLKEVEE